MSNPGRAFYVREITRRVDEQINSVRRELSNMLGIGVIKSDSVDNKLYYEVDQTYAYFQPLQAIFDTTKTKKAASHQSSDDSSVWTKRLRKLSGVKIVIVSGGFMSGTRSKVDLMMVGSPPKSQLRKFIKELEEDEHRTISYSVMSYDDFYYRKSMKDRFVSEIIEGNHKILLDTTGTLEKNSN